MDYSFAVRKKTTSETRVPVRIPVVIADGGDPAQTKNLSIGGLYLITRRRYPVGEHVELRLEYDAVQLRVTGRVTHQQADGCGFSFVNPEHETREAIRALIDNLLAQAPIEGDDTNPRIALRKRVSWSYEDNQRHEASLRQLARAGAYLFSEHPAKKGASIFVYFPGFTTTDDPGRASEVRGSEASVTHVDSAGFGVRFVRPSAEFQMAVERLIVRYGG